MIDLITEQEKILTFYKINYRQHVKRWLLSSILFFGISTLCYRFLIKQMVKPIFLNRLATLYSLSLIIGTIIVISFLIILSALAFKISQLIYNYPKWLKRKIKAMLNQTLVKQDSLYYYLTKKTMKRDYVISKESCCYLTTTIDNQQVMIGLRCDKLPWQSSELFILPNWSIDIKPNRIKYRTNYRAIFISCTILFLSGLFRAYGYITAPITNYPITNENETSGNFNESDQNSVQQIVSQTSKKPINRIDQMNQLQLDHESNDVFMTTNFGKSWEFVPLKLEWLRFGDYTLTTGTIPVGYWMDKTFDLSPDWSWLIFSPKDEQQSVYQLSSKDSGQTWQKNLIGENLGMARYRKLTFFNDGSGVALFSTRYDRSSETISIYTTADYGNSWQESGQTTITQPIQNTSYLSQVRGFIATRNDLYYTDNYSHSFKDTIVTIPSNYSKDGIDLFQSPMK
ncbi:hypothetical protein CBF34_03870 [Vagococcus penaei]|uniref:Uncharacterized protein n=3 Tax=Vagococcus penaei TaxID=633807 RepID=A0A1Q2D8I1_9ENTE|nr:hypothetical protein BW732_10965 [Vagococcus penaei]RSU05327.1 hypothetical protein CBF34_03870 [Vagococcus penaei]